MTLAGQSSHGIEPDPRDVIPQRFEALERRIQRLETANPLQATTISSGGFEVDDDNGQPIVKIGTLGLLNGQPAVGVEIFRDDGSLALTLYSDFVAIWDKSGNYVVTDDATSGQGLARPYLFLGQGVDMVSTPSTSATTSSSFVTLIEQPTYHQHPKVRARVWGHCSDGTTTGDVRMIDLTDGSQVGDVHSLEAGANEIFDIGPASLSGSHLSFPTLAVQARRTGGNGTVALRGMGFWGTESNPV